MNEDAAASLRDQLVERLEAAKYPVAEIEEIERGDLQEIVATLVSTAVESKELDQVVGELQQKRGVRHATWESSTKD